MIIIALALNISCSNDLNFTLPEIDPLLSIQSFNDPDIESEMIISMARPLQSSNIEMNTDCQANLFENNLFYKRLFLDTSIFQNKFYNKRYLRFPIPDDITFSSGSDYRIEVTYPGFEKVTAESERPELVKIKKISWRQVTGEMPEWYYKTPSKMQFDTYQEETIDTSLIEFNVTFDDPPESLNFYRIGVNLLTNLPRPINYVNRRIQYASTVDADPCFMKFNYKTKYPIYSGWNNPTTYEILWNDKNFNGEEHSIKILVPLGNGSGNPYGAKIIISLYALNEDYYKYMVTRWEYSRTEDDPFAEPVKLYSNASNGCGIFAFSSLDVDTIVFSKSR